MNWESLYNQLIETRRKGVINEATHKHHIIPRHLGGTDSEDNFASLTIRDHAFAHWILWKWKGLRADKVAWLMLSGKTHQGELERIKLAFDTYTVEDRRKKMKDNNPMFNKDCQRKAHLTRREKYNGSYHSSAGLDNLKKYSNSGNQQSPEAKEKRRSKLHAKMMQLSSEQRRELYGRFGLNNGNYGKKRPGNLAGNFGTSKGVYIITYGNEETTFNSLTTAMQHGYSEGILKRYRNTDKLINSGPHKGKKVYYIPNESYGEQFKQRKNKY